MAFEHWMTAARLSDGQVCFWAETEDGIAWVDVKPDLLDSTHLFSSVEAKISDKLMELGYGRSELEVS